MLDTLFIIALTLCWILGFFVSAQFLHQQFEIAKKLDELRKQENVKVQSPNVKGMSKLK
ncbi:MAG: hypothetical protein Q6354_06315 [Candidatus Brocadiales bacterium]|nr:hypothetical protein [Candidatus Brocadiales bacterium]